MTELSRYFPLPGNLTHLNLANNQLVAPLNSLIP
nr:hypothetical protein [Yersinia pestis]